MKKVNYVQQFGIESLIESRLVMQSTQRALLGYGVSIPTLKYILSEDFYENKYKNLGEFQKRNLLQVLAGPLATNWSKAKNLIEQRSK